MLSAQRGARPDTPVDEVRRQRTRDRDGGVVLDVRHVSVEYASAGGAVHAVDDVSLTLGRGQILGLAGESGSGKSTLAYAVARLLRPPARITQGEVLYYPRAEECGDNPRITPLFTSTGQPRDYKRHATAHPAQTGHVPNGLEGGSPFGGNRNGKAPAGAAVDVLALTPEELRAFRWRQLAIVFQSAMNALNPVMDIGAQIDDVLRAHDAAMSGRSRRERAAELLRMVDISPDRLRSYPHELSGGMRQRAVIAIALALEPEIIIMDEPTTALDVVVQREILAEITALRDRLGFSVIFITHDLSLLLEVADVVAIMYAGRIAEMATSASLRARPRHPYSYGLLHSFPTVRGPRIPLTGIPGSPPDLRTLPGGCAFHPRCSFAFDACRGSVPPLRPASGAGAGAGIGDGQVACHLYDERTHPPALPPALSSPPPAETSESSCPPPTGETPRS